MINVNAADMQLFNYCVEQLFSTFIDIKQAQQHLIENVDTTKFRVPIRIHFSQKGKKFIIPTKMGKHMLSRREIECLQCLIDGLSAKETGTKLFLSPRTVETYLNHIKDKLKCRNKRDIISLVYIH
jgi:DNA-binding CsgD family transcriptional regulator